MTSDEKVRPLQWTVVCPNFVSLHGDDHLAAIEHATAVAAVGKCKERHTVMQTNLGYGSRHEKGTRR